MKYIIILGAVLTMSGCNLFRSSGRTDSTETRERIIVEKEERQELAMRTIERDGAVVTEPYIITLTSQKTIDETGQTFSHQDTARSLSSPVIQSIAGLATGGIGGMVSSTSTDSGSGVDGLGSLGILGLASFLKGPLSRMFGGGPPEPQPPAQRPREVARSQEEE